MKIVFIMPLWRRTQFVRIFESTLRLLCERGHHVHVGFVSRKKAGHGTAAPTDLVQQLVADYPNCSCGTAPIREDAWGVLGATLRASSDYLRYLTPPYRNARMLRERAAANVLPRVITLTRQGPFGTGPGRALVKAWCRFLDRCIPVSAEIDRFLMEQRPDLLLCSPLIEPGTPQMEYVRAARARGIRVVLCVASWDNLTNKGLIHGPLDLVTVWNDAMKREAVELHGVPAERVAVTGAQLFDHWFDWRPSTPRDTFCARVGLTASQPYILYLCSSGTIAPDEPSFVRKWTRQLRESPSSVLRDAGVLVRPHPDSEDRWLRFDDREFTNFAIYPPAGAPPVDATSRADYFDSIYHSAAVVAVNTTAEIESAIVGRQVYTVLDPEFRDTQEGTLHFHHLRHAGGGLVREAVNFADHFAQLEAALRDGSGDSGRCRRFVEVFVRPHGVDVPATPKLVASIEGAGARTRVRTKSTPVFAGLLQPFLRRWAERLRHDASALREAEAAQGTLRRQEAKRQKKLQRNDQRPRDRG